MKNKILFLLTIICELIFSQNWQRVDSVFSPSGIKVNNFTCPFFADLNGDGLTDLILGNGASENVKFFKNIGPATNPVFLEDTSIFSSIYSKGSQGTNSDYPCAVDLTGDDLFDLIVGGFNGLLFYKNIGTPNIPQWEKIDTIFTTVNAAIGTDAKPAFADLDGDGDFDLLVGIGESLFGGPTAGVTLGYRNIGTQSSPKFIADNTLVTNIPDIGLNSYPALADLNNDGDNDLILGRDISSVMYYDNTGTSNLPVWTRNTSLFQSVETTTYWKNPTFCDLNSDGLIDLVYGNATGKLFFYKNIGTLNSPVFQQDLNYLMVIKTNEAASTVCLFDYDKDGDYDLLSGNWLGKLEYFRNDGTPQKPLFKRVDLNFSFINVNSYSSPVFADINNDGNPDIVTGALNGKLACYIYNTIGFIQNATIFSGINVVGFSHPAFVDIDADGDLDLFVGAELAANAKFYENVGNNIYQPKDSLMLNLVLPRSSKPSFSDVDNDGDYDLFIGDAWGELSFYENTGTKFFPVWVRKDEVLENISVRQNSAPGLADLDGDKKKDLVIGDYDGNFTYYKNIMNITSVSNDQVPEHFYVTQNFPNPFNSSSSFYIALYEKADVSLNIYNTLGKKVVIFNNKFFNEGKHLIRLSNQELKLPSGIYFYQIIVKSGKYSDIKNITKKFLILN